MAYERGEYYIWRNTTKQFNFSHKCCYGILSEDMVDVFLSAMYDRKKEFKQRVRNGKKLRKEANKRMTL